MTDTVDLVLFLGCIAVACAGLATIGCMLIRWGLRDDQPAGPDPDPRPPAYTIRRRPYDWAIHHVDLDPGNNDLDNLTVTPFPPTHRRDRRA